MAGVMLGRVLEKLDEYLAQNDFAAAERHLKYWLSEAEALQDGRGTFALWNELVGLYRKCGQRENAQYAIAKVLSLVEQMELSEDIGGATAYINAATAYKSLGCAEAALPLYEKAERIYREHLQTSDGRLGALYNNMGLTLTALGRYHEAEEKYRQALKVMENVKGGEPEMAITCLNMAELAEAHQGLEAGEAKISALLDRAEALLDKEGLPQSGNYAYVCEKCAPGFLYYGRFLKAGELEKRAERIRAALREEGERT